MFQDTANVCIVIIVPQDHRLSHAMELLTAIGIACSHAVMVKRYTYENGPLIATLFMSCAFMRYVQQMDLGLLYSKDSRMASK